MEQSPNPHPAQQSTEHSDQLSTDSTILRWAVVLAIAIAVMLIPVPQGVTPQSWRLLAIFAATIMGSIVQPLPGSAMVLLGVTALPVFRVMTIDEALTG